MGNCELIFLCFINALVFKGLRHWADLDELQHRTNFDEYYDNDDLAGEFGGTRVPVQIAAPEGSGADSR